MMGPSLHSLIYHEDESDGDVEAIARDYPARLAVDGPSFGYLWSSSHHSVPTVEQILDNIGADDQYKDIPDLRYDSSDSDSDDEDSTTMKSSAISRTRK